MRKREWRRSSRSVSPRSAANSPGRTSPMSTERITTRFDGAVAYVTLAHPPVNVIDFQMIAEIKAFLESVREEPRLCAVVFQGAGRNFSAGVDIPSHLPATVREMLREV